MSSLKSTSLLQNILPPETILGSFKPKMKLLVERGEFLMKTATEIEEVIQAARLRYEVFFSNPQIEGNAWEIDLDPYDQIADHLIVIHKKTNKIVGTYRLLCSKFTSQFYSETEFNLANIKTIPQTKVELGRACIHPEFRTSMVIPLLWKGLVQYAKSWEASLLFGCSSVYLNDTSLLPLLNYTLLSEYGTPPALRVNPRKVPPSMEQNKRVDIYPTKDKMEEAKKLIPPLLLTYIKAGAKIAGYPAWDPEFNCLDYFTLFDFQKIDPLYQKRFVD